MRLLGDVSQGRFLLCVLYPLESCNSVDFDADLRDQFIDYVGESKLVNLKPQLVDGSYVQIYQVCSSMLAENNGGQNIKSLVEAIGSAHKAALESAEGLDGMERIINYLEEELLR